MLPLKHIQVNLQNSYSFSQDLGAIANPMFKMKGPAMIKNSYPPAFPLKHQQKDMRLALALGDENAVPMPVAAAANEVSRSKHHTTLSSSLFMFYCRHLFYSRHSRRQGAWAWETLTFQLCLRLSANESGWRSFPFVSLK